MINFTPQYDKVIRKIFAVLGKSSRAQQHMLHSRNALQWLERVYNKMNEGGNNDQILPEFARISALGHDIECANIKRTQRADYTDYLNYRKASHIKSAQIVSNIMREGGFTEREVQMTFDMINSHENGGSDDFSQLLCNADALSYFDVVITFDYSRFPSIDDIYRKMKWEYNRMSPVARQFLKDFHYPYTNNLNIALDRLLQDSKVRA